MQALPIIVPREDRNTDSPKKQFGRSDTYEGKPAEPFLDNWVNYTGIPHSSGVRLVIVQTQSTLTESLNVPSFFGGFRANFPVDDSSVSIVEALASKVEEYEQIETSFSGVVVNVERAANGEPEKAIISVSVEGKDYLIERSIRSFDFDVKPEMSLEVDCVVRGGQKRLVFRLAQPAELDEEEIELLKSI